MTRGACTRHAHLKSSISEQTQDAYNLTRTNTQPTAYTLKALVLVLLVAGLLTAGTVRGAVNAKPATAVQPGGSTTPQPPRPTPTPTAPLPPACELEPLAAAPRSTGSATASNPSPTPGPVVGDALVPGQYQLQRSGDLVTAILTTRAAPLPPPPVLFTVPVAYRPPSLLWRDAAGRVVRADGAPHPAYPEPVPFRLWLHPDGTVRQALQPGSAGEEQHLAYELTLTWGTTPAANDHAVLALLDERWFGTAVLSATPPKAIHEWQAPPDPYRDRGRKNPDDWPPIVTMGARVTFNDQGRVAKLSLGGPFFTDMPSELGQLSQLEELVLRGWGLDYVMDSRRHRLASNEPLPPGLTGTIPPELGNLVRLQELNLSRNLLSGAVPPELGSLTQLRRLELFDNWLTTLPPEIGQLHCLRELDVGENFLLAIPPELGLLANLTHLFLDSNLLTVLPPELGLLANLRRLDLFSNLLYELPPELGLLANLEELILMDNGLTKLPPELGQLQKLHNLAAHRNRLTSLPPELVQLQALTHLSLSNNRIATIPPELGPLAERDWDGVLHGFDISYNPLTCVPAAWLNHWPYFTIFERNAHGRPIERRPPACPD